MRLGKMFIAMCVACGIASAAQAAITATWVQNTITPAAIANDPQLGAMQSWSLMATNTDGQWASAGLRVSLPAGNTFYHQTPFGGNTKPSPAIVAAFPAVAYDTYVSSSRDAGGGTNAPAILGPFPENQPPQSFGGASDAIPGTISVSWGDPQATSGPGAGTWEIARITFPLAVPAITVNVDDRSQTSQINPDGTTLIPDLIIPEPGSLGLLAAAGLLVIRRR